MLSSTARLLIIWVLLGGTECRLSPYLYTPVRNSLKSFARTDESADSGFLNIKKNVFKQYVAAQFFSMGTDKDLLPWNVDDETTNRQNHVKATAFLETWRKLYAMETLTDILDRGFKETNRHVKSTGDPKSAITFLCDYLERELADVDSVYAEYQKTKAEVQTKLGTGPFTREVHFRQLSDDQIENDKNYKTWLNTTSMKLIFVNWVFVFQASMWPGNSKENYVMAKSTIDAAVAGVERDQLQAVYDKACLKTAESITYTEDAVGRVANKITEELNKGIGESEPLKKAIQTAMETVLSSKEMRFSSFGDQD